MARSRLDAELVRRNLAPSRAHAQEAIAEGRVLIAGMRATKAATQVDHGAPIEVVQIEGQTEYVSRGAYKLLGALKAFEGQIPPIAGAKCLDAGSSTGGFTDVLLRAGAAEVVCVDVGYNQLVWSLRDDPRVTVQERTNIRYLTPELVGDPPQIVVGDLSFISLTLVLPALMRSCPGATMMLMVKPQFEVGKGKVGAGGVVRDPSLRAESVLRVAQCAIDLGLRVASVAASPLPGPAGNVEYFLLLKPNGVLTDAATLEGEALVQAINEVVKNGPQGNDKPLQKEESSP